MDLSEFENSELVTLYGNLIYEMKKRNIIRTKNVVGDLGEFFAINYYTKSDVLPSLYPVSISHEHYDATTEQNTRYSIKTTTSHTTGVFYGLNPPETNKTQDKLFEYALIVLLDENYQLKRIVELDWNAFLKHKRWHSRMQAWHLIINKELLKDSRTVYSNK